ncbi:MAG: flavin reductase family protein [Candidatus Latescibacteria bacterium]|nr:flavin reductase family protein [Candidatus Latescibacterota bacterium]
MGKKLLEPGTVLSPTPVVLVTVQGADERPNIITLAWVGIVSSGPPMMSISIRSSRHSHKLIEESAAFVINIPPEKLVRETDYCGVVSCRKEDKFEGAGLTPVPAEKVNAPLILECPVNIECEVRQTLRLGAHDMYLGEVVAVHADEEVVQDGGLNIAMIRPLVFCPGDAQYWNLGTVIGSYGFTKGKL